MTVLFKLLACPVAQDEVQEMLVVHGDLGFEDGRRLYDMVTDNLSQEEFCRSVLGELTGHRRGSVDGA